MNFRETLWEKEARILAAVCFDYQLMPHPYYSEGATNRPWIPIEVLKYSLRRFVEKKITFKEIMWNDEKQQWVARNSTIKENVIVPFFNVPGSERMKANQWVNAILDWDETKLATAIEDLDVKNLIEGLAFTKNATRVDMNVKKVTEGEDLMELMGVDASVLKKIAKDTEERQLLEAKRSAPPVSFEQYKADTEKEISEINQQILKSGPKQKKDLAAKKAALIASLEESIKAKESADAHMALANSGANDKDDE